MFGTVKYAKIRLALKSEAESLFRNFFFIKTETEKRDLSQMVINLVPNTALQTKQTSQTTHILFPPHIISSSGLAWYMVADVEETA
jgi:hypothetical protein